MKIDAMGVTQIGIGGHIIHIMSIDTVETTVIVNTYIIHITDTHIIHIIVTDTMRITISTATIQGTHITKTHIFLDIRGIQLDIRGIQWIGRHQWRQNYSRH